MCRWRKAQGLVIGQKGRVGEKKRRAGKGKNPRSELHRRGIGQVPRNSGEN